MRNVIPGAKPRLELSFLPRIPFSVYQYGADHAVIEEVQPHGVSFMLIHFFSPRPLVAMDLG